ncbi:EamA family transporter [Pseudarthrobacter sulfonivorans]|uniref:DMT family transporter n=1 Tax=Pseudarthrobacter sulfonivorans TaxID=121292 RepID=UPI00285F591A|nr:EamA family transporter [Pseudarthrobacter sulfonivorans]MDR6415269.1 DME family drug/metabolite transporter [Pseudarthrobacter sulfonivorans]
MRTSVETGRFHGTTWGALFVLAASVLWGTTGTAATFAPDVSPLAIGAVAMGFGGLLQAAIAARPILAFRLNLRRQWHTVALGALAVAAYPLAFYSSMHLAGVAVGTVVSIGSAPLASAVIEKVVDKRPFTGRWIAGAVLGVAGAVLLCLADAGLADATAAGTEWSTPAGVVLGLLAGLTYALYSWAAHRLINTGVPSRAVMGTVFGIGGLLLMPVLAFTGAPLVASWQNVAVGAYMALVPMFAGYVLFGWGLARVRASTATTLSLSETVVAAVLAVLVVGERLPALGWLGAAMIAGSLFILTLRPSRNRATPAAAGEGTHDGASSSRRQAAAVAAPAAPPD